MCYLPGPGTEPVSPALAGGFFTPEPPGKPLFPVSVCFPLSFFWDPCPTGSSAEARESMGSVHSLQSQTEIPIVSDVLPVPMPAVVSLILLRWNPPATQEPQVRSLSWEDPLEEGIVTHSSILAWRIPRTEEPGGLSPWGHEESDMTEMTWRAGRSCGGLATSKSWAASEVLLNKL